MISSESLDKRIMNIIVSRGVVSLADIFLAFSLNVWLYKITSSHVTFLIIASLTSVVPLLFSTPIGFIVDKYRKTKILIFCDIFSSLILFFMIIAFLLKMYYVEFYALFLFLMAIINEFRYTSMSALIPNITKNNIIRYNGLQQFFRGVVIIVGPVLGVIGSEYLEIGYIFLIAILAQFYAIYVFFGFSKLESYSKIEKTSSFFHDYKKSISWIFGVDELKRILIFFIFLNAVFMTYNALILPYILGAYNSGFLAVFMVSQGAGLLVSSFFLMRKINHISPKNILINSSFLMGFILFFVGFSSFILIVFMSFLFGMLMGFLSSSNQTIWQIETPSELQGKVIAVRSTLTYILSPIFIYLAIPFTNKITLPLVSNVDFFNKIWGSGSLGSISLLISILGVSVLFLTIYFVFKEGWFVRSKI